MTDPLKNRSYLHRRHRLSHQQIDRWLGENRAGEFMQEKLMQLDRVRLFLQVTDKLRESNIAFVCLKGPLLSQRIYGDPTIRISQDLDLLVEPADLEPALKLLEDEGFHLMRNIAWPKKKIQQELMMLVSHHISLYHQQLNLFVELHWTLIYNLPVSQKELKRIIAQNLTTIDFAGHIFTVMNCELELLFLLVHGARHGWSRFKWLADIHDYPIHQIDKAAFILLVERLKAERIIAQTNHFLNLYFKYQLPDPWSKTVTKRMIRFVQQNIDKKSISEEITNREYITIYRYLWHLFPGINYKLNCLFITIFHQKEISGMQFNSKIAYYLFCPLKFIKRRLFHG